MSDNIQRSKGRGNSYKFDRGGVPTEFGPYIGVVKNNVDPTRTGRLQVYIEQFAGNNPADKSLWRTVKYVPPYYGITPPNNASTTSGVGSYKGNPQSYGMWFTPPDVGVSVICFFVAGDPNQGYYIGCIPEPGLNHMIPAIGATRHFKTANEEQTKLSQGAGQLPVVEINSYNKNTIDNPRFWDDTKPVHSYLFGILVNQGLITDYIRGPISSSSQRESPSSVFGFSTPGRPIYQGGLTDSDVKTKLSSGSVKLSDIKTEGRRGGHSIIMDDGDLTGQDNLIRIRTAKGHQITMSDEADCFYFISANGQTWIEMGSEGTVDVYSTNSVNIRSQGEINLQADKNININAGENLNVRAKNVQIESQEALKLTATKDLLVYGKASLGILSDGSVSVNSSSGGWLSNGSLSFKGSPINLNSGEAPPTIEAPKPIAELSLDDTKFVPGTGWQVEPGKLKTIVTRAPTHEPYPYHNRGVPVTVMLDDGGGGGGDTAPSADVEEALAGTTNEPVSNPIDASDILTAPTADVEVGSLDKAQVTGLLAQASLATGQKPDEISPIKGIGQFGLKPNQLEAAGLLKPGSFKKLNSVIPGTPTTADIAAATKAGVSPQEYMKNKKINQMLASPTMWTGKNGVTNLTGLLSNPTAQSATQQTLMNTALLGLQTAGVMKGTESAAVTSALVQSATQFGVGPTKAWTKGVASQDVKLAINATAKSAQFSTKLISSVGGLLGLGGSAQTPASAINTVNRSGLDSAILSLLGDAKIQPPSFTPAKRQT